MPGQLVPAAQFPFCGPTNLMASPVFDAQRCINLYPDPGIASSKTKLGLVGRPGLAAPGITTLGGGSGHALYAGSGRLFVATGTHVYEVDHAGAIIQDYGTGISNTSGPSPCAFVANGTQLLICDPNATTILNVDAVTHTLIPVKDDTTAQFFGVALEYLNGRYYAIATGSSLVGGNPNQINASNLNDGTIWPVLAFITQNGTADLPIQLAVLNNLLFVFGQKSINVYYDAGNPIIPIARMANGVINLGCLAQNSVVKFNNTVLWLGSDNTGWGQVYMLNGMNPSRVSNAAIEYQISTAATPKLSSARAYGYQEAGHTFYVLNLRTISTGTATNLTLVYDLTTGLWHERQFTAGLPTLIPMAYANVPTFPSAINSSYVLDEASGQIWYSTININSDAGTPITYTRTAPHVSNENQWIRYPRLELDCDIGTAQPVLDYSNDGGRSFLGRNYPMQQAPDQGTAGAFQRFYTTQLGRSRDRVFKVSITDSANPIRIAAAYLTAGIG